MNRKYIVSKQEFSEIIENLQKQIDNKTFDMYVCILNGGKHVSDALGIYYAMYIEASHYTGKYEDSKREKFVRITIKNVDIHMLKFVHNHFTRILVIDDVLDTGDTATAITNMLGANNDITLAVAIEKEEHRYAGNVLSGKKVSKDDWVIFDWEQNQ